MLRRFLVVLFLAVSAAGVQGQSSCDVQVVTSGVSCAGRTDGTAKVVVNGQTSGTPAGCQTADAAPSYSGSCTSTYSSNTGEVLVAPGQQVCLTASNFTGGIQATGGTLVISGNATPAYMNLNGSNPSFTLIVLGTAQFSSLNLFGSSTVSNYGTLKVPSVGFNGTLINNGTLQVTGDLNINSPYGNFTNKGTVTVSSNFNNYNTTTNGGTITVSGTIDNNSGGTLSNQCTITAGGDLNNDNKIINQGSITVAGKAALNGSSLYQGYAGALLSMSSATVDGIVQGMSSACSSIKVSGSTIINSSAIFSGAIDYCDANGIETNTGTFTAPASKNCSCSAVSATYAWQSPLSGTSDHVSNLAAGTYSVQVSAQGCTAVTKTFTITSPAALSTTVSASGLSATATVSGGTAPYSYVWSGNQSTQATAAYAASGTYTLTVTDSKGCSSSQSVTVTAPTTPPTGSCTVTVQTTNPTCAGSSNGTATIYVNGSVLGTGSTGTSGSGTPAGCSAAQSSSYSCTSGCTQTVSDNNAGINVAAGQQVCLTAGAYAGNINVTGGTLVICGKATPQNINYNTNGASFTLIVNGELTLSNLNLPASCTLKNYGKVTYTSSVSFSGTVYNYGTMVAGGDFNNNSSAGTFYNYGSLTVAGNLNCNVTGVNSGTLQITGNLQNNGGGTFTNNCTIVVGNELINNASFTNNGNISVAHWTRLNGGSTMSIGAGMLLSTQNLTLDGTVTGAGSTCSALQISGQSIVNGSGKLQGNVSMCDASPDGTDTFTGTVVSPASKNCSCILQPIQYSSPLAGMNNPYQGLPAGTYTVTVQTQGCAASTQTFTITDPPAITASVSVSGMTATVTAGGGQGALLYTWSDGTSGSTGSHTYVNNGSYSVTVSDSKNCSKTLNFHIPVQTVADSSCNQLLVEYPSPGQVRITCVCAGVTSTSCSIIDGSGTPIGHTLPQPKNDSIVQVNTGPGTTTTGVLIEGTNHTPYVNPTGDGNPTGTGTGTGTGTPPITNTLSITATPSPESCAGKKDGSIQLSITGGSGDYSITNNATTQTGNTTTISNVGAGTVLVQVYDNKTGYSKTASVTVGTKTGNSYQLVVNSTQPTGEAASVSLQVTGSNPTTNTVVQWSTGASGFGPVTIPSWLYSTGYISATVSESWVCPQTYEISVVPNCTTTMSPVLSATDASCYGSATGQVSISNLPSGGSIVWSGTPSLSTGSSVSGLTAGVYRADVYTTLSNGNKCKAGSGSVTVNQPARLQVSVSQGTTTSPTNTTNNYTAQVSGGVGPYSYQWSTGIQTATATLTGSGYYQVQVTDSKSCVQATQIYIPVPPCSTGVNLNVSPISCLSATSGSVTATSAISGASYYWSGAGITSPYNATQSNLGEGLYVVSVSGWNPQCLSRVGVQLKKPAPLQVSSKQVGTTVSILVSNGTPNYKIVWRFDNKQADTRSDLTPGVSYTVDVTDAKGCTLAYTFTYDPCSANPIVAAVKMSGTVATPVVSGGAGPYTYLWALETVGGTALSDPTQAVQTSLTGTYHLTVTDTRACTATITITGPNCGLGSLGVSSQAPSCNSRCDASAQISGTLPAGAQITWDNQAVAYSFVNACWGTHTVQIKNAQGCYIEQSFTIASSQSACTGAGPGTGPNGTPDCSAFSVALQSASSVLAKKCATDAANIDVQISGGKPLYHMSWDVTPTGSATTQTFATDKEDYSNALPGSYTLHVTDQQGCSKSLSVTVTGPQSQLSGSAAIAAASCPEQLASIVFTVSGGSQPYSIKDLASSSSATFSGGSYTITPTQAGAYSYQLSDAFGCTQQLDATLPALPAVVFSGRVIASQTSLKPGDQAILTAVTVAGYNISWPGFTSPAQVVQRVSAAGTYSATYSRTGCPSYTRSVSIGTASATDPVVKSILCTSTEPVEITLDTADYCSNYKRISAMAFGQYQYELYVAEQKFNIRQAYLAAIFAHATESLTMNFTDNEQQYTLYYYDQSGNLVRTVPPSGVKVLSDDATGKAMDEIVAGTHNTITTHDYTTTYAYNSLNQLVHQDIPDHMRIDLWQTGSSTANLNGGKVAAVGYGDNSKGLMLANTTDKAQLLTTADAGKTWQASQSIGLGKITSFSRIAAPSTVVYAGGENGTFLASANGGRSWSLLPLPTQSAVKQVYFSTEQSGWIITLDGSMYTTADGGHSWTSQTSLATTLGGAQVQDVTITPAGIVWILSSTNHMYQSSTAAATAWSEKVIDSPAGAGVSALSSGVGFAGPKGTLFTVSGSSLQVQRTGLDKDVQRMISGSNGSYYALTTAGEVYYSSSLSASTADWQNTGLSGITSVTNEGSLVLAYDGTGVYSLSGSSPGARQSFLRVRSISGGYLTLGSGNTISLLNSTFGVLQSYSGTAIQNLAGVTLTDIYPVAGSKIAALGSNGTVYEGTIIPAVTTPAPGTPAYITFAQKYTGIASFIAQGTDLYLKTTGSAINSYASGTQTVQLSAATSDVLLTGSNTGYAVESGKLKTIAAGALAGTPLPLTAAPLKALSASAAGGGSKVYAAGTDAELYVYTGTGNFTYVPVVANTSTIVDAQYVAAQGTVDLLTATSLYSYSEGNPDLNQTGSGYSNAVQLSATATAEVLVAANGSPVSGQQSYSVEGSQYPYTAGGDQGKLWYKETAASTGYTAATINVEPLAGLAYASSTNILAVGKQGTILTSTDAGTSWKMVYSGTEADLSAVSAAGNTAVAIGAGNTVLYSSNGGATWSPSTTAITAPTAVKVSGSAVLITAGTKIYRSINGGQSFTVETPTAAATLRSVWLDNQGYGYVVGDAGAAYRITPANTTTTNTFTYTAVATDANTGDDKGSGIPVQNLASVQFSDRLTGYITGTNGLLLKTVDGGYHWKSESAGATGATSGTPILALSSDAQNGTLVGSDGSVQSLNDQAEQFNSRFWYDELGRLILSQNAKQFTITAYESPATVALAAAVPNNGSGTMRAYSYTLYDAIGRITEVGEILSANAPQAAKNESQILFSTHTAFVANSYKHQTTKTFYDQNANPPAGLAPTYLRNRVAYTTYQQEPAAPTQQTHYSYDVHGNVNSLVQIISKDGQSLSKRVDYEYDLVSGKVNRVCYQKGQSDQLIHKYSYDGDNRITQVQTSSDGIIYSKEASYDYYAHGLLARKTLGELGVETENYAYTIQGWIKQMQAAAFSYALGYNETDYAAIGSGATLLATPIATVSGKSKGLYNGNIASMTSNTPILSAANFQQQYSYDQLNRITASTTPGGAKAYSTAYSYDGNGNIKALGRYDNTGTQFDTLSYNYETKAAGYEHTTNKLRWVDDVAGAALSDKDIDDQNTDNYSYDAIGNLIKDVQEEIDSIQWTVTGKVHKVVRTATSTKPNLEFEYDANGQRIIKKVIRKDGSIAATYYLRDASGNVMTVYEYNSVSDNAPNLAEQYLYGSSRIGVSTPGAGASTTTQGTVLGSRGFGLKSYELSDHLGNVRTTLSDYRRLAAGIVNSATDYYPFGMIIANRQYTSANIYRYGFQSQEHEDDLTGGDYEFGCRINDSRIGRFLSVDPISDLFPHNSPYAFGENRVIDGIELEGLEFAPTKDKNGQITDYVWKGFNADGSAPAGTVAGGTVTNGNYTMTFSSNAANRTGSMVAKHSGAGIGKGVGYNFTFGFSGNAAAYNVSDAQGPLATYSLGGGVLGCSGSTIVDRAREELGFNFHPATGACDPVYPEVFLMPLPKLGWGSRLGKFLFGARVSAAFGRLTLASEYGIAEYSALRALTKGTGVEVHHLIEQRFATLLGQTAKNMPSIVVTKAEHLVFTKAWRAEIGYAGQKVTTTTLNATKAQVEAAARKIYKDYPEILKALGL